MSKFTMNMRQAAKEVGVFHLTIFKWVHNGYIKSHKVNPRRVLVDIDEVKEFCKKREKLRQLYVEVYGKPMGGRHGE